MIAEVFFDFDVFFCDKGFYLIYGIYLWFIRLNQVVINAYFFELPLQFDGCSLRVGIDGAEDK